VRKETGLEIETRRLLEAYAAGDEGREAPHGANILLVYQASIMGGRLKRGRAAFFGPEDLPETLRGAGHDQAILAWRDRVRDRCLPDEALQYCPRCTYPLEERLVFARSRLMCPACGFIHFRSPKVGISVMVEDGDRVLLIRRAIQPGLGQWSLPSGFVEWDEPPETAAAREVAEETGLAIKDLTLLEATHYVEDYRGPGINLTYLAAPAGGALSPGDDADAAGFFLPSELPERREIAFRSHRRILDRWRSGEDLRSGQ
jgi:ADP-ribose pyrophosphatase YjhB (NUDIX family)